MRLGNAKHRIEKLIDGVMIVEIDDGTARDVSQAQAQRHRSKKNLRARDHFFSACQNQSVRAPAKLGFEFAPFGGLQKVSMLRRDKVIPGARVGSVEDAWLRIHAAIITQGCARGNWGGRLISKSSCSCISNRNGYNASGAEFLSKHNECAIMSVFDSSPKFLQRSSQRA